MTLSVLCIARVLLGRTIMFEVARACSGSLHGGVAARHWWLSGRLVGRSYNPVGLLRPYNDRRAVQLAAEADKPPNAAPAGRAGSFSARRTASRRLQDAQRQKACASRQAARRSVRSHVNAACSLASDPLCGLTEAILRSVHAVNLRHEARSHERRACHETATDTFVPQKLRRVLRAAHSVRRHRRPVHELRPTGHCGAPQDAMRSGFGSWSAPVARPSPHYVRERILPMGKMHQPLLRQWRSAALPEAQDSSVSPSAVSFVSHCLWAASTRVRQGKWAQTACGPHNSTQKLTSRRMPRPPAEPARAARDGRRHAACRSLLQSFSSVAASGAPPVHSRVKRLAA